MDKQQIENQRKKIGISKTTICRELRIPMVRYNSYIKNELDFGSEKLFQLLKLIDLKTLKL